MRTKSTHWINDRAGQTMLVICAITTSLLGTLACSNADGSPDQSAPAPVTVSAATKVSKPALTAEEKRYYRGAAKLAWEYMNKNYDPRTGYVKANPDWANTTIWDIGAQILAYYSAKELGFLTQAEFDKRTAKTLQSMQKAKLFRGITYNKTYSTVTGGPGEGGLRGWSATDLGRLLVALKVLSVREPRHAAAAAKVAGRMNYSEIIKDGYLYGQLIGESGKPWTFQEGRIGYEQYMAAGFKQWNHPVDKALSLSENAEKVEVMGVELLADKRWQDRLVSEPFLLYGLELGMPKDVEDLARNMLRAQEERFKQTGQITMTSEDAIAEPPDYFYYYCVYCSRKPFVVDVASPGEGLDKPRWVSTKATHGYHALMPNDYTRKAVQAVEKARDSKKGWASGIYEKTGQSTGAFDINTASVMLEIAYYQLRGGKPMIQGGAIQ